MTTCPHCGEHMDDNSHHYRTLTERRELLAAALEVDLTDADVDHALAVTHKLIARPWELATQ